MTKVNTIKIKCGNCNSQIKQLIKWIKVEKKTKEYYCNCPICDKKIYIKKELFTGEC